ncbi:hypothetical protein EMIHUDRAFT_351892 [Emiliania huxleyi CCMP1516]|uniref:Uncharacterized protein n=2 Tax=Emiliania huxleyi TaxID=2903 RepID=A0A0D3KM60_EMIH1|nr:hypothetical protein EMIHUDRAFT_374348 [Emiliania huxleyi CCMP1516]XP_005764704.1 hypothetical protein EMIHUDRAFT_374274 [Emiliania huxleyi CCMP1516]XP_005788696.1 hypothetical protein EMIHUDRAFT_362559 [Emiliania huxleyi CCMP1516]XP_005789274.1 hypothetical protein EMIHUDRAFT_351892 [Emiliania huxleyi CCMP1516]EOD10754.1 hypothetical protein EMIHUDRAFT_374348 [Emiliania huxleyi CCMP1516]EOD12275.1 hypothetical protein EMIHUDRAFT_374274 [Emiliania huxleyi CCMP1516]EOD36267.1 hypothetical p|eukprot:XP_005763183.1 hypothetical protein EMIHUDRAFT_374348 [Emiliania huxleyi CCMP1516]
MRMRARCGLCRHGRRVPAGHSVIVGERHELVQLLRAELSDVMQVELVKHPLRVFDRRLVGQPGCRDV